MTQEKFSLLIDNIPLTQVKSSKFLGVYVDEHLTWNEHINNISIKLAKSIGVISRIAYLLPSNIRFNLYFSLICPYLSYCNIAWASNYTSRLKRLSVLQRRAVRIVARRSSTSHTINKFYDLRILIFKQINKQQISEFMYRFTHNLLPSAFSGYFFNVSDIHSYHIISSKKLLPEQILVCLRLNMLDHVFRMICLQINIRNISSVLLVMGLKTICAWI